MIFWVFGNNIRIKEGDIYINNGSHGCVNLPHNAAKEIYENVDTGTMVLVHN